MKKNNTIVVLSVVLVVAIVGVASYAVSQNGSMDSSMSMSSQESGNSSSTSAADAEATDKVTIADYKFAPAAITVKKGTTVTWTNQDTVKHNVVTEDGAPEAIDGKLIGKGETYSYTFNKTGTYNYFCEPHPYMKASVIVTE